MLQNPSTRPGRRARTAAVAAAGATLALLAGTALAVPADSTPVGPLPQGPVTTVTAKRGTLVAVALTRPSTASGLVWRVARRVDSRVLRQVSEADVGPSVVAVFRAVGSGRATVAFAATKGDSSAKAVRAATYRVTVS